jgi:hypothetical protein
LRVVIFIIDIFGHKNTTSIEPSIPSLRLSKAFQEEESHVRSIFWHGPSWRSWILIHQQILSRLCGSRLSHLDFKGFVGHPVMPLKLASANLVELLAIYSFKPTCDQMDNHHYKTVKVNAKEGE